MGSRVTWGLSEKEAPEKGVSVVTTLILGGKPQETRPRKSSRRENPQDHPVPSRWTFLRVLCVETPSGDSSTPLPGTRCHPVATKVTVTDHCCRGPAVTRTPLFEGLSPSLQLWASRPWPWCPARPSWVPGSSLGGGRLGWCRERDHQPSPWRRGSGRPRSLIFGLGALTPQAWSTWQRTCFMRSRGGSGPLSLLGAELCPLPLCPQPQEPLAGEAGKAVGPTSLIRHRPQRTPWTQVTRSQDQAGQRATALPASPAGPCLPAPSGLCPWGAPAGYLCPRHSLLQRCSVCGCGWEGHHVLELGQGEGSSGDQAGGGPARGAPGHGPGDSQPLCPPWAAFPTPRPQWSHCPSAWPYLSRLSLL